MIGDYITKSEFLNLWNDVENKYMEFRDKEYHETALLGESIIKSWFIFNILQDFLMTEKLRGTNSGAVWGCDY